MVEVKKEEAPKEGAEPKKEEPKTPPAEEKKEEGKEPSIQEQMNELKEKMGTVEDKNNELTGRNEVLQDSLDSLLEEAALNAKNPKEEPKEEPEKSKEEKEEGEEKIEGEPVKIEKEIEKSIKEDETHRSETNTQIEGILDREAERNLESNLKEALIKFPEASESEILLDIEDGSDAPVMELAKVSHEARIKKLDETKVKNIDEYKEQLKKEGEGGISVPQSPGSSIAPGTPKDAGVKTSPDDEWGNALDKSKVEGGGA